MKRAQATHCTPRVAASVLFSCRLQWHPSLLLTHSQKAIGNLSGRDVQLFAAEEEFFELLPKAEPGEWLDSHTEEGQPVADFRYGARTPRSSSSSTCEAVYLAPLGEFNQAASPDLEFLRRFVETYLCTPCHIFKTLTLECDDKESNFVLRHQVSGQKWTITSRINPNTRNTQLLTTDLSAALVASKPSGRCSMMAITMWDLYPDPKWNFVFGQANQRLQTACFSFARYNPSFPSPPRTALTPAQKHLLLRRAMKVSVHELIHTFGIHHCIYFQCLMNGSNHLEEADARPIELCPVDLRKLQKVSAFDVCERYARLIEVYKTVDGFNVEIDWLERRLTHLKKTSS